MPSSVIGSYVYDKEAEQLTIQFTSGNIYIYLGVPEAIYTGLDHASSRGEYFNQHIRDRYEFIKAA